MNDFARQFFEDQQITTISVIYHRPDFRSLLQEFIWQTLDVPPKFPRIHRFLNFWKTEIRVPIRTISVAVAGRLIPINWTNPTMYEA